MTVYFLHKNRFVILINLIAFNGIVSDNNIGGFRFSFDLNVIMGLIDYETAATYNIKTSETKTDICKSCDTNKEVLNSLEVSSKPS